jgi:hypothetical protein
MVIGIDGLRDCMMGEPIKFELRMVKEAKE